MSSLQGRQGALCLKEKAQSHLTKSQGRKMRERERVKVRKSCSLARNQRIRAKEWSRKNELHAEEKAGFKEERVGKREEPSWSQKKKV